MRLLQLKDDSGRRRVARVGDDKTSLDVLAGYDSTLELARDAIRRGCRLDDLVRVSKVDLRLEYDAVERAGQVRVPIDHPDPAHLLVSGTGITHLGSATARNAMHPGRTAGAERGGDSDSMRMFRLGVEGGKPAAGKAGVQPEWFYKGDGSIIAPPGTPLTMPAFALTGGEEAEIVGVYVIDDHGTPRRIGFVLGNEFSDHGLEEQNYLYSAHSKLRECSLGPELLLGDFPGPCAVWRACCVPAKRCGKVISGAARITCRTRSRTSSIIISSTRCSAVRVGALPLLRRRGAELRRGRARGARRRVQARRAGVRAAIAQHVAARGTRKRYSRSTLGIEGVGD